METRKRSFAKTISFRIFASIATILLVLIVTGNFTLAGVLGGLDLITKLILYYFHERIWQKIPWGFTR